MTHWTTKWKTTETTAICDLKVYTTLSLYQMDSDFYPWWLCTVWLCTVKMFVTLLTNKCFSLGGGSLVDGCGLVNEREHLYAWINRSHFGTILWFSTRLGWFIVWICFQSSCVWPAWCSLWPFVPLQQTVLRNVCFEKPQTQFKKNRCKIGLFFPLRPSENVV